tara:strand:- start:13811 stop:14296 length:486 start_codon:yes stop_codon:yes gene_type:complete
VKHIIEKEWKTGGDKIIDFYDLLNLTKEYTLKGSRIFIGSDSFISRKKICFSTAICLFGSGGPTRYFFFKDYTPKKQYINLVSRISEEARRSVEIAQILIEEYSFKPKDIELHLDVSPSHAKNGTSKLSDMLTGYVQGYGVMCKIKPNAWASQTVADKHSK